jgi:outer membrane lipoprotein-sorting protein
MKRRLLLGGLAALALVTPSLASAEAMSLKEISKYLNDLLSAKGAFTQVNPDGTLSKGTFYIKRPGRMRFEYEPPNDALVVAGQSRLAVFDNRSNAGPQQYPLHKTPLHIILKRNVNLNASGMVTAHQHDGTSTTVTAQDPENPSYGNVKLVFTDKPTELRQWIVTDQSGQKTTVILGDLDKKSRLPGRLFDIDRIVKEGDKR